MNNNEFIEKIKKMKWNDYEEYLLYSRDNKVENELFIPLLQSDKKQVIELVTQIFVDNMYEPAIKFLFEFMASDSEGANAIRARNALIKFGTKTIEYSKKYIYSKKWIVRLYTIQILALTKNIDALKILEPVYKTDRSGKVNEAAHQAVEYILGITPIAECFLLPKIDERELRIGVQDMLF